MSIDPPPIDYAARKPAPPVAASRVRMFAYLMPAALFVAAASTYHFTESLANGIDTLNWPGLCCAALLLPVGLVYLLLAVGEACRPNGWAILVRTLPAIGGIAFGPVLGLYVCWKFDCFKHW